ncbi:MAG: sulfite exporter TauE/SafE family protein [Pseudomonadales bacterium]
MNHLFFFGSCVAIGVVSGFLGGLLGIGGGVVIVPALIILFDALFLFSPEIATPVAVATSLACIIFTSISAAFTQMRANMVDWPVVRRWAGFLVLGSFAASFIAIALNTATFRTLIGCFLLFVSFVMLTNWKPSAHRRFPGPLLSAGFAAAGGVVSGIAGIGGGNVVVPTLLYFNIPVHRATATSSTLGVPIATAGTLGYIFTGWGKDLGADNMLGYVYVPAFIAIVMATMFTAPLGVWVAHRLPPLPLRRGFGVLLILVSARMLYSATLL